MTNQRYVLVAVETAHIQSYIFASNRLRENVGASYLVAAATGEWALATVMEMVLRHNLAPQTRDELRNRLYQVSKAKPLFNHALHIENGQLDAEVLYSGGGNIVLLFADEVKSREFIHTLSRKVQIEAPGLGLTFSARLFDWNESLCEAVGALLQDMKKQRGYQPTLRGDAGQGVQMMCASTSFPAVIMDREANAADSPWQPYSAETHAKRQFANEANEVLRTTLGLEETTYDFPLDFDDLGRSKEDTSYVAVVHADGNGLGLLIQALKGQGNREYIERMRELSEGIKEVAQKSQQAIIRQLLASLSSDKKSLIGIGDTTTSIELQQRGKKMILPFRPLVSGGDDVSFVCDGRIGLDLAVMFLREFEVQSRSLLGRSLTACAGVAIVKTHYPFARAYDLADDLAGNAKQARQAYGDDAPSALDWHVTAGGLYGDLDDLRQREYRVEDGNLTLRPVFVADLEPQNADYPRTWSAIRRMITQFQTGSWRDSRNKAEGLREVLRKGAVETAVYKARYLTESSKHWSKGKPPYLPEIGQFEFNGWRDGVCGYYDALELVDKYLPLKTDQTQEAQP